MGTIIPERDKYGHTLVTIKEEDINTGGHYQAAIYNIDVPATAGWAELDISYPFPISILSAEWTNLSAFDDDEIEFLVAPNTIIGVLTQDANSGVNEVSVSQTVLDNARLGGVISITNGTTLDECGRCFDITDTTIKFENNLSNSYLASSPTYVRQSVMLLRRSRLPSNGRIQLGDSKIGGSYVPANVVLKARYNNKLAVAKKFWFVLEYLY